MIFEEKEKILKFCSNGNLSELVDFYQSSEISKDEIKFNNNKALRR